MPEFKEGQLVAVKIPGATKWELRVFERVALTDEPFCVEVIVRRPENATGYCVCMESVCPAEEVWPEIFLGRKRRAGEQAADAVAMKSALVQRLRKQIAWLCRQIMTNALHRKQSDFCPPLDMPIGPDGRCQRSCIACWEQASLKAVEDAKDE